MGKKSLRFGREYWQEKLAYHTQKLEYVKGRLAALGEQSPAIPKFPGVGDDVMLTPTPLAFVRVGVRLGRTYNLGCYESARMDISYDAPCLASEADAMREALAAKVEADLKAWADRYVSECKNY